MVLVLDVEELRGFGDTQGQLVLWQAPVMKAARLERLARWCGSGLLGLFHFVARRQEHCPALPPLGNGYLGENNYKS